MHIGLPHFGAKVRTADFDVNKEPPSQLQFSMDSVQNLNATETIIGHLSKFFSVNNVQRTPSASVAAKKREILMPREIKRNHQPSHDVKNAQNFLGSRTVDLLHSKKPPLSAGYND
jgi:hypothetical protein